MCRLSISLLKKDCDDIKDRFGCSSMLGIFLAYVLWPAESSRMCWLQILVVVSRGNSVTGVIEFFRKEENILKGKSALYEIHWPGLDGWRALPWIPERSYQGKVGKFTSSSYSECESE